jgi:hypothetical protein
MKTKKLLLLCLLIGMGLAVVSAQSSDKGDNRAISYNVQTVGWMAVYCDGFHEDLYSNLDTHIMEKYNDGKWVSLICQYKGEAISSTGEVFKWSEVDKVEKLDVVANQPFEDTFHANLNGNQGSHYILSGYVNYSVRPAIVIIDKALCLDNKNK